MSKCPCVYMCLCAQANGLVFTFVGVHERMPLCLHLLVCICVNVLVFTCAGVHTCECPCVYTCWCAYV